MEFEAIDFSVDVTEYRLTFEMADPYWAAGHEHCEHTGNFTAIWSEIPWQPVEKITFDHGVIDQFKTLRQWAATKEQPVRYPKLETRTLKPPPWVEWQDDNVTVTKLGLDK